MTIHEKYMHRCLELAKQGAGYVSPNPMVGAVLVYDDKIIGEGYHQKYGEDHAEVNCLNAVKTEDRKFISAATLYVSLEPCNFFGKTPACTDLIIKQKIPKIVIGCKDPNSIVDGKGIEKLLTEGLDVEYGILEKECIELNKRFYMFQKQHRPYIILKWAQSADNKMAGTGTSRLFISNEETNRLVHKWRSEEASILVGTNTALLDDPELTNRFWEGPSPIRLVLDLDLRLPESLKIFNQQKKTIIFNKRKQEEKENLIFYKIDKNKNPVQEIVSSLYHLNITSVLVEGGAKLLQSFIDKNYWDEIRIIKNEKLIISNGLSSPVIPGIPAKEESRIGDDVVKTYIRN